MRTIRPLSFASRIARAFARFASDRQGNTAVTFAIALIPLLGFVGAAVDYSRASSVKAALQTALDSTALMLSRDAATLSASDLQTKAGDYFKAIFTRPDVQNITVTATYNASGGSNVIIGASMRMSAWAM